LREHLREAGPYELIVVDDGSTDDTARLLREAAERDPNLRVVIHPCNRGYGASLKTGILHATAEYIVITDADGTYPNERIPELVEMAQGVDMVVGSRTGPDVHYSLIRKIPKLFLRAYASWISRTRIPDLNSGLRVFRRDLARRFFFLLSDGFSFTTTITLAMLTNHFTVRYVPINYAPRVGRSKIRPIRDTLSFFHLIFRAGTFFAPMRTLFPLAPASFALFMGSLIYDTAVLQNITEKTILLLMFSVGVFMFTLLADTISLITKKVVWEEEFEQARGIRLAGDAEKVVDQSGPRRVYEAGVIPAPEPNVSDRSAA
jgi:glycosyltransferase involved in cell wall biosynthesis